MTATDIPVITGPGLFSIELPGEREYRENFNNVRMRMRMRHGDEGADLVVQAYLTLGDMAVAVSVGGQVLGYLPGAIALEFREAVQGGDLTEYRVFECAGCLRRRAPIGQSEEGTYSIWLDLPQESDGDAPKAAVNLQPDGSLIHAYRRGAIADRQVDEFIGIVKGVMADGMVTQGEVEFLLRWMEANRQAANLWPAKALYPRLVQAAAMGVMSLQEEGEVLALLMKTVGGNTAPQNGFASNSTSLPLTKPFKPLIFEDRVFCFTGTFHSGTRDWCHAQVDGRRGRSAGTITKKLDYLVIGDIGNETWIHSTHGRKIEKAIEYNAAGCGIVIVSEEHWYSHL